MRHIQKKLIGVNLIMPTYNVKHKETGETKEFRMTIEDYEQWRIDNPDWDKDWTAGVASMGEVGDWRDKMKKTHPGWADVMGQVKKHPNYGSCPKSKDGYQW